MEEQDLTHGSYRIYSGDQFHITTRFREYSGLRQLILDLEDFRKVLKSSNPGFSMRMRTKPEAFMISWSEEPCTWFPKEVNDFLCRGTISILSPYGKGPYFRTKKVESDFQRGVSEILEKHGVKKYKSRWQS